MHAGMSYQRLEAKGGIQWPCYDEDHPGEQFLHARLWDDDPEGRGEPAPFTPTEWVPPADPLSDEFPMRLTTGRRLDSYNTGVQSGRYSSPIRNTETIDIDPEDGARLDIADGQTVRVVSRRGEVTVPARYTDGLRPGLAFMTPHFPDEVDTNTLTIDAWDPKSGTAEFKATAIRIETL